MPSPQYGISSPQRNNQAARTTVTGICRAAFFKPQGKSPKVSHCLDFGKCLEALTANSPRFLIL